MNKIALLVITIFFNVNFGNACTCIGEISFRKEFRKTDVVFLGRIVSISKFQVPPRSNHPKEMKLFLNEVKINVLNIYKGKLKYTNVTLITGIGNGDCGIPFVINENYLIFSNYKNKYTNKGAEVPSFLYSDRCSRTKRECEDDINRIPKWRR